MEKITKQERNTMTATRAVLLSAIINLVIAIVIFCISDISYETNDDFSISRMLAAEYPYVGFVNYFLCKTIIVFQKIFPAYNVFVIAQIIFSFISFSSILYTFLIRNSAISNRLIVVMTCAFYSFDHYSSIQFTKTAAVLMTAGILLVIDNYIHKRTLSQFVIGFVIFYLGVALRQKGMLPALSYAGVFMMVHIFLNYKEEQKNLGSKILKKEIALIVILAIVSIVPFGIDKVSDRINEGKEALKLSREYQSERRLVTDYPLMKYYESNKEAFDEIGISKNDLYLMSRWMFDYDGAASLDNLKKINEIVRPLANEKSLIKAAKKATKEALISIPKMSFTGMHILIIFSIAVYMIATNKPKSWLYILLIGALTIAIYIAIYYIQRPQYRALYIADESAALWLLYASSIASRKDNVKISKHIALIATVSIILMFIPATRILQAQKMYNESKIIGEEVCYYFEQNKQWFFIGPTTSMGMSPGYDTPLIIAKPIENMADTGGWDTLTPYRLELLSKGGVNNPIKDLLNSSNVVFFGNGKIDELKEYYEKWYCDSGEEVVFEKIDEINNNGIYQVYSKPHSLD